MAGLRQKARDFLLGLALLAVTAGLVLFPKECMQAARDGLTLCGNVIIPSLFPFFVLSALLVELGLAGYLGRMLEGIMRPLFRLNGACASAVALGLIGGYPVGAKTAIDLYENGMCTRTEAERLLAFCNNSGPAFVLGVVGAGVFGSSRVGVLLYLTHVAASLCVGLVFRFYKGSGREDQGAFRLNPQIKAGRFTAAFTDSVKSSFFSTLNICAFVIFFTVLIKLLALSGILPGIAQLLGYLLGPFGFNAEWGERLLTGILEISTGVWTLSGSGALTGRVAMAAFMLGWAGLSVHCQVLSFVGKSGLSSRTYFCGKLLQSFFSVALFFLLSLVIPMGEPVSALLADQVDGIAGMDFGTTLTGATLAAWGIFLIFFLLSLAGMLRGRRAGGSAKRKSRGHGGGYRR